jgi:Fusaric acid resistance protein-like
LSGYNGRGIFRTYASHENQPVQEQGRHISHLAKNERDMGHPLACGWDGVSPLSASEENSFSSAMPKFLMEDTNSSAESATASLAVKLRDVFAREVRVGDLLRALIALGPLVVIYFLSNEPALLDLGLVSISLLLAAQALQYSRRLAALQLVAILVTFLVLLLAAPVKPLFVLLTGTAAFLAVALTRYGASLRTVGTWTFLPALYLACKVHEEWNSGVGFRQPTIIVALAPVALALVYAAQLFRRRTLLAQSPQPQGQASWLLSASATAIAVFAAATAVETLNLAEGQWMIWSAASVVVGDIATSAQKLKMRALGACVGVPLGLWVGHGVPASRAGYSFAVLGATLTLVAFHRYAIGFGARCFFIALAAAFAGGANGVAEERVINVVCGGMLGITAVILSEVVGKSFALSRGRA